MSNREIVEQGRQARKDVKAAEARAAQAEQNAAEVQAEREYDRLNHKRDQHVLQQDLDYLVAQRDEAYTHILKLTDEIEAMKRQAREQEKDRRRLLVELAKAFVAVVLIYGVRDLDLVTFWLANGLAVAFEIYAVILLAKLLRKKK